MNAEVNTEEYLPPAQGADRSDALSELARQRREEVARDSDRPKPDFLQSVEQSEVIYSFDLSGVPFRQMDIRAVSDQLDEAYGVQLDGPDFSPLLSVMTREQLVASDESVLLRKLVSLNNPGTIKWKDGRFPLRDDFIEIRSITLNYEAIQVNVAGESEVAELVAKETMELIWRLAGSKKSFDTDLKPLVLLTAYGTRTRLQLGYGPEVLLNQALLDFFDANMSKGRKFAKSMGRQKTNELPSLQDVQAVTSMDSLTLKVHWFNPATGYTEDCDIEFDVTARSDYRTGRISCTTRLPYDRHMELLTALFGELRP